MAFYKVCNSRRTLKKIVANPATPAELEKIGKEKLAITGNVKLVQEEDGCEIDHDTPLEIFPRGTLFMIVEEGDKWSPQDLNHHFAATPQPPPVSPSPSTSAETESRPGSVAVDHPPVSDVHASTDEVRKAELSQEVARKLKEMPLPRFYGVVSEELKQDKPNVKKVWAELIKQAAWHYFPVVKDVWTNQGHYILVGPRMIQAYPMLRLPGPKPWSAFNKALGLKIRKLREKFSAKSQKVESSPSRTQPCFSKERYQPVEQDEESQDDVQLHLEALQKEWKKASDKRSTTQIRLLLKYTKVHRQDLLRAHPAGRITPILEVYPCLQCADNVMFDMTLRYGSEKFSEMKENLTRLVRFLLKERESQDGSVLDAFRYLEETVAATRGKFKSKPVIVVYEDAQDKEIKEALSSPKGTSPSLVLISGRGSTVGHFIVADDEVLVCDTTDTEVAIMQLLATYHTFDLEYPRPYSACLGYLQTVVIGEPYKGLTTNGYKFLLRKWEEHTETE